MQMTEEGARYGMKSNKDKCELMHFGGASKVRFTDGMDINIKNEVKYLGCISSKAKMPTEETNYKNA